MRVRVPPSALENYRCYNRFMASDLERLQLVEGEDLRMYIRAHGFTVNGELLSLVQSEGPEKVLSHMKSIVNEFEDDLKREDIPIFEIAKETRKIDFGKTIEKLIVFTVQL